jgi:hypothetical protein
MNFFFHVLGLTRHGIAGRILERIFHKNQPDCDRKAIENRGQSQTAWWVLENNPQCA